MADHGCMNIIRGPTYFITARIFSRLAGE